jgi:hypothetical protein
MDSDSQGEMTYELPGTNEHGAWRDLVLHHYLVLSASASGKASGNTHPEQVPSIYRYLHHALHLMYDEVVQATRKLMYYGQPSSAEKPDCVSKKTNVNTWEKHEAGTRQLTPAAPCPISDMNIIFIELIGDLTINLW